MMSLWWRKLKTTFKSGIPPRNTNERFRADQQLFRQVSISRNTYKIDSAKVPDRL